MHDIGRFRLLPLQNPHKKLPSTRGLVIATTTVLAHPAIALVGNNVMKEATFDSSVEDFAVTAQPHFDDERTVQSAQPVVPLEVINTRVRRRKQWFLGGAFAIAMMLGAASALVASYLKLRNLPPQTTAELSEVDVVAAPVAAAETEPEPLPEESPVESPVESQTEPAVVEETEEDPVPESPKKETAVRRRTVARAEPAEPRDGPRRDEDEELDRIRSAVLYDEWQERRARRAQRRERRRLERYNHRDLSNLDEIFEGRRKP